MLHGADRDVVWLQRDFGIYICNLFDTGQVVFLKPLSSICYVSFVLLWLSLLSNSLTSTFGLWSASYNLIPRFLHELIPSDAYSSLDPSQL